MPVQSIFYSMPPHCRAFSRLRRTWLRHALTGLALALALALALPLSVATARDGASAGEAGKPDAVTATMAGEFALQAGKLDQAAQWYLAAARASQGDAGLAERASRIALLSNDDALARAAVALWKQRDPESLQLIAAEVTLALRHGNARSARKGLAALMRRHGGEQDKPGKHGATTLGGDGLGGDGWRYALVALGSGGEDPKLSAKLLGELVDKGAIPDELQAWLAFGGLAQRLDQQALTERIVQAVIVRFPGEPRVALLHASQLREADKPDQAKAVLAGLEAAASQDEEVRASVAAQYDALGDKRAAMNVMALGLQDDHTYRVRAALLAQMKDTSALEALYAQMQAGSSQPDPSRRLLLGQTAEFLERYADALQWYRSVPSGEERWQARLRAASVLYELKRMPEAVADLRAMQADASIDEDARRDAYLLEAQLRQQDDDTTGEFDTYARGLAAFPDDSALLYGRGLGWERRDDIPRAEADLRRILVTDPENVAALNALGYTLADRTTRYEEALQLIDRARVAEPGEPAIIDSYGWVLYRLGRNDDALVQLRRAFALQKDPDIAAHLGEVLWVTGRKDEARKFFAESEKLEPGNRALKRALETTGA